MTIWYKQGVVGDLQPVVKKALGRISNKGDVYITSIRDGNHSPGSLHHIGCAFDMRKTIPVEEVRAKAGKGFDVVEEPTHIHIEYDPK